MLCSGGTRYKISHPWLVSFKTHLDSGDIESIGQKICYYPEILSNSTVTAAFQLVPISCALRANINYVSWRSHSSAQIEIELGSNHIGLGSNRTRFFKNVRNTFRTFAHEKGEGKILFGHCSPLGKYARIFRHSQTNWISLLRPLRSHNASSSI